MQRAILVLSKNASLIELIRSNLEEGGRYYVQGVTSVHGALSMVRHHSFDLAILDLEQSDLSAAQLIHNLKAIQLEIKILVYDHQDSNLIENSRTIPVDGFLARPFFAPELSDHLKALFAVAGSDQKVEISPELETTTPGLLTYDPESDIEEISVLLERTSATAAMTFVQGKPTAKTKSMSPSIAQKISEMIAVGWTNYKGCDFCRFLKAENEMEPCLIYSLSITPEMILAFTYPPGSDLRAIRQETTILRDAFMINHFSAPYLEPGDSSEQPSEDHEFQRVKGSFMDGLDSTPLPILGEKDSQWVLEMDDSLEESLPPDLEEILDSRLPAKTDLIEDQSLSDTQPIRLRSALPLEEVNRPIAESSSDAPLTEHSAAILNNLSNLQENTPVVVPADTSLSLPWEEGPSTPANAAAAPPAENVLSAAMAKQDAISHVIPQPRKSCNIFHCVIIPHSPRQFLTRELGEKTASIIRRHHQMNGWELSHMTIRPQYAMWTVNLPVSIDPVKVVEEIKAETSEWLLSSHPDQIQTAEDQSFWASGYWILSGQHPPSGNLIKQFLNFNSRKSAEPQDPAN